MTNSVRLTFLAACLLQSFACSPITPRSEALAAHEATADASNSVAEWGALAREVFRQIDWSQVCDADVTCLSIRVDSMIRLGESLVSVRSSHKVVGRLTPDDFPAGARRFALGDRDDFDVREDVLVTMVVWDQAPDPAWSPSAELEIRLVRPRRDEVGVVVWAERSPSGWRVLRFEYRHS